MNYKYLDKVLTATVKRIYKIFEDYRSVPIDELNVTSHVRRLYEELDAISREAYRDIAKHYYESEPHGDDTFMYLWLEGILFAPSKLTKYTYDNEVYRKRDRLIEALIAAEDSKRDKSEEYTKAMRSWTQMVGWYGIEVADEGVRQARLDDGVKRVMWVSEHDNRVCGDCHQLDGRIFPMDAVPVKPHPGCRCHLERVRDANAD